MAIEIISTLKQKNNGNFALVDSNDIKGGYYQVDSINEMNSIPLERKKEGMLCYVKGDKTYQLEVDLITWAEFKVDSIKKQIEYSTIEPIGEDVKLWVDISDTLSYTNNISDEIIEEFRAMFKFMQSQIDSLKQINIKLEARISYLEQNTTGGDSGEEIEPTTDVILTFEDGTIMTFEDGSSMTFEIVGEVITNDIIMTFEDGTIMTFEDGSSMIFEIVGENTVSDIIMTFEDGTIMTFEDGKIIIFEK